MAEQCDVVVVGAGMAGLAAALDLTGAGLDVRLLERAEHPGGRVATDLVDGFRLDRGFQVLNTSYPQVRRRLDLAALDLRDLTPGALVRYDGKLRRLANPLRRPQDAPASLGARLLPSRELAALAVYSARVGGPRAVQRQLSHGQDEDVSAADAFAAAGVGPVTRDRFLRPFLAGVLLEDELATSRRFVDLVWRSFVRGRSVLPAAGIGAVAAQLAAGLPRGVLQCSTTVRAVRPDGVDTDSGPVAARAVVLAADPVTAAQLLGAVPAPMRRVTTYYHAAERSPLAEPTIVLDGEGGGPVVNTVVLTEAVPEYAPPGVALISSSVLGPPQRDAEVRAHLQRLYGTATGGWRTVAVVDVRHALPVLLPGSPLRRRATVGGIFVAGDHRATPSLQGALANGTAVARDVQAVLR
ncbi:MAG: FAD-dependent oxidoreductase [bacterium]